MGLGSRHYAALRIWPSDVCLFLSLMCRQWLCQCASRGLSEGLVRRYMINISSRWRYLQFTCYFQFRYLLYPRSHPCSPAPDLCFSDNIHHSLNPPPEMNDGSSAAHNWPKLTQMMCGNAWRLCNNRHTSLLCLSSPHRSQKVFKEVRSPHCFNLDTWRNTCMP